MDKNTIIQIPTTEGYRTHTIYTPETYDFSQLKNYPIVRDRSRRYYINIPVSFDIEATTIIDENYNQKSGIPNQSYAFIYQWQMCIDYTVIMGRTISSWLHFMQAISQYLKENGIIGQLPIYVHFLSYEFQFIKNYFKWDQIFARKERQPIRATTGPFEFRCSYYLSNMSLAKFCENTANVTYYKLVDTYDYKKYRFPDTPLSVEELQYCFLDVYGLNECIREHYRHDSAATIPLTSTGFVRRECREAMKRNPKNREIFKRLQLTLDQYKMCREAFRGGDTHANHIFSGNIISGCKSKDISSSYPAWMLTKKFPMSKFIEERPSLFGKIDERYCWLAKIRLLDVRFDNHYAMPYIDIAHCTKKVNIINDNGRILKADLLEITITDVDWEIIKNTYKIGEIYCSKLISAKYDYLPYELREMILKYFESKSKLKNVPGKEYEYLKSKNKLNGIFGMMVTDIVSAMIEFEKSSDPNTKEWTKKAIDEAEKLQQYYKSPKSFLAYQWGVWVTAHARYALHKCADKIGLDNMYQDTDCSKYTGDHDEIFEEFNKEHIASYQSLDLKPEVTVNGKKYIMGIWEDDGSYDKFITWGSKKYCYEKDYKCYVTVSGLNKEKASLHITEVGIEEFKPGHLFQDSGRTLAIYGESGPHVQEILYEGMLHKVEMSSYVATLDTTYTLGITNEYREILNLPIDKSEYI